MISMTWTDDRVEALKKLWSAGLSSSQIAAELSGPPFQDLPFLSRNAAIGKIHRLGLSGRVKPANDTKPAPRRSERLVQMRGTNLKSPSASLGNAALALSVELDAEPEISHYDNVIPIHQRLSLLELTASTCHWPIGDPQTPEFFFCGGKVIFESPYCAHHSRVAHQPASDRRRLPPKPIR